MTITALITAIEPVDEAVRGLAAARRPGSASAAILRDMATFDEAAVAGRTDGQSQE